jgi:hypothetical protein
MRNVLVLLLHLVLPALAWAGPPSAPDTKPIQDNSFLIEEAYNQERGVVQHINTFQRVHSGDWVYTFTRNGLSLISTTSSASPSPWCAWRTIVASGISR